LLVRGGIRGINRGVLVVVGAVCLRVKCALWWGVILGVC